MSKPSADFERIAKQEFQTKVESSAQIAKNLRRQSLLHRFILDQATLLRHLLIVESTGSGKTNHTFRLIKMASEEAEQSGCVVVDVKREYRALTSLLPGRVRVVSIGGEPKGHLNPLAPPKGVDVEHWDRAFADVFTRAYGLSEPSRRILLDSLFSLRRAAPENPTLRELENEVGGFKAGSPKEQNGQRSLESRLHIINTGPIGESLNTEEVLDVGALHGITVFEIGEVDSLKDQRFLAEFLLLYLWQHDRSQPEPAEEKLRRLIVVEEAHRYLSEERPPEQREDRTLLELAIAEARRYGWGFLIIDQMPLLLSRYVWDNMGTVIVHRLANMDSYNVVKKVLVINPLTQSEIVDDYLAPILLSLPEDIALYRKYVGATVAMELPVGVVGFPR